MALLTNVLESDLGIFDREHVENVLKSYTNEAQKRVKDLLLSTDYSIAEINYQYTILDETDLYGNFISREWIFSTNTEF